MFFVGLFGGLAVILFVLGIRAGLRDEHGDFVLSAILWWMFSAFAVIIGGAIYLAIMEARQPHYFLNKSRWDCTATVEERSLVLVGKVLVPRTTTVCVQYSRH